MWILLHPWKRPKISSSHKITPMTTTPLRIDLMLLCMGMKRFTSQSRRPTTMSVTTRCMRDMKFSFPETAGARRRMRRLRTGTVSLPTESRLLLPGFGYGAGVRSAGDGFNEGECGTRGMNLAVERGAEGGVMAIDRAGGILILLEDGTVERDAGEHALRTRVGEELGVHLPISARGSMAADGGG